MTEDYKKLLLGYLVGDLKIDEPKNDEITKDVNEILYSNWQEYLPEDLSYFKINGLINIENEATFVFYGSYMNINNAAKGMIIITNDKFKPLKLFTKYNNGTDLRCIYTMQIADDNTFFAVDGNDYYALNSTNSRLILLNNFATFYTQINDYFLDLRKSYILPSNCHKADYKYLIKNPNSSHYFIAGQSYIYSSGYTSPMGLEVKINVGTENEWVAYIFSDKTYIEESTYFNDVYAEFNQDDKLFFEIVTSKLNGDHAITILKKDFSDTNWNIKNVTAFPELASINLSMKNQVVFKNKNEFYFVYEKMHTVTGSTNTFTDHIYLCKYDIQNSRLTLIHEEKTKTYERGRANKAILLCKNNNDIYVLYLDDEECNRKSKMYYFRLYDKWSPLLIDKIYTYSYEEIMLFSMSKFNLLQLCILNNTLKSLITIKEDYNPTNYNSSSYTNDKSLNSDKVELFSNNSLVFARNLYNKSINNSTTISTVEIPNTYLNDIPITQETLLSKTNIAITNNNRKITKNIYETLYLNFINTLGVINKNNANNQILNPKASSYLNQAINTDNSYENTKMSKYRINYQDETKDTKNIVIKERQDKSCIVEFALAVMKKIKNIEFISNDEMTIYHTIDLSDLEVDKIYKISQKIEVI